MKRDLLQSHQVKYFLSNLDEAGIPSTVEVDDSDPTFTERRITVDPRDVVVAAVALRRIPEDGSTFILREHKMVLPVINLTGSPSSLWGERQRKAAEELVVNSSIFDLENPPLPAEMDYVDCIDFMKPVIWQIKDIHKSSYNDGHMQSLSIILGGCQTTSHFLMKELYSYGTFFVPTFEEDGTFCMFRKLGA